MNKAWEQSKDEIDQTSRYGTWNKDYFLSKPEPSGRFCHADEIRSVGNSWPHIAKVSVAFPASEPQHLSLNTLTSTAQLPC